MTHQLVSKIWWLSCQFVHDSSKIINHFQVKLSVHAMTLQSTGDLQYYKHYHLFYTWRNESASRTSTSIYTSWKTMKTIWTWRLNSASKWNVGSGLRHGARGRCWIYQLLIQKKDSPFGDLNVYNWCNTEEIKWRSPGLSNFCLDSWLVTW